MTLATIMTALSVSKKLADLATLAAGHLHANGDITDAELAAVRNRASRSDRDYQRRVEEAKARLGNGEHGATLDEMRVLESAAEAAAAEFGMAAIAAAPRVSLPVEVVEAIEAVTEEPASEDDDPSDG